MKHTSLTLLLAAGLLSSAAQAQSTFEFGPRLGLNYSTMTSSGVPGPFAQETKYVTGVQVGATLNLGFSEKVAFQPSLLFSQKGAQLIGTFTDNSSPPYKTTVKVTATPTLSYLELPLNVVYTAGGTEGFQLFGGPYVAAGVGGSGTGTIDVTSTDPDVLRGGGVGSYPATLVVEYGDQQNPNTNNTSSAGNLSGTITVRRFDAGLNAGIGYRVGPFQAQLGYGLGLVNFVPKDTNGQDTGSKGYHRAFQLSANYFLGGK